ncbi:putative protein in type-1 retrotransposable element R1DM [Nymphon striatum]|nr:putative protein in type-1 retrotransposable element R1DM [Nymphon striatum]
MVDSIMVEIASLRSHLEDAKGQLVKLISKDRIHKPDTVKFLNKSMKVALAKLSNIEKSVSEGATVVKERPSQPTYANVVAKAVASHRSPPETIIVESQDADIKTAGQLQALVKDSVNLREAKIGVTNIRHAGTKLIIKTQNSVDKGTLVNLINNTLKAKVKVWAPQKWRPNILVKNVPEDVKDDDIVDSILDQNNLVREDDSCIKKRFSFKSARGCRHVVLDVSPGMFKTLNSLGRVLVGWTSCRLEKFISVKKCTACFGYGHSKKECKNVERCPTCGVLESIMAANRKIDKFIKNNKFNDILNIGQLNLHTSKVGTAALIKKAEELSIDVLLLQEIYTLNDKTAGFPLKCRVAEHNKNNGRIKACIVILNDNLNCQFDKSHSSENICIVNILTNNKPITLISAYTEPRSDLQEFLTELDQILQVVGTQRCILAMDTNSHSLAWGSDKTDSRGRSVEMLLGGHNMFIVNNGCTPTFNNVRSTSFIDVTVAGSDIYPKVSDWSTHGIFPGCDHEFISYVIDRPSLHNTFRSTRIYASHRIPKSKFIIKVKEQFKIKGLCPSVFSCVDSSTKLNNLVQQFSDCISTACNRQLTKKDKTSCKLGNPWWSKDLSIKHNEVQAARRRYQKTKTSVLRNLRAAQYKKLLSKFKKSVQHAKRVSWRAFCSQVSRTNPFSDAYKLCRSEFRRKHLDEPLLDSNGHRYADVAEECKALMNYHLGDEDGIQPETIVTPEGADDRNISAAEINRIVRVEMEILCPMYLNLYPLDVQTCHLSIESAPAHSIVTLNTVVQRVLHIAMTLRQRYTVLTVDQALFPQLMELKWAKYKDTLILRLGGLHISMNFLKVLGQHTADSGLDDVWKESGLLGPISTEKIMMGKSYAKGVRAHKLTWQALWQLLLPQFISFLEENNLELQKRILDMIQEANLKEDQKFDTLVSTLSSPEFTDLAAFVKGKEEDPNFMYWWCYMEMVSILMRFCGQDKLEVFVKERLINSTVPLRDTLSKSKALTFSSLYNVKESTQKAKDATLKADRNILQCLITAYQAGRKVDLDMVLQHELLNVSINLTQTNRALRTGNKAILVDVMTKDIVCPPQVVLDGSSCLVVDGQAAVVALGKPENVDNFGQFGDAFVKHISDAGQHFNRVDVTFDRYHDSAIKEGTRNKRSKTTRPIGRIIESRDVPVPHKWKNLLALPANKEDLAAFLSNELITNAPAGKTLVVAGGFRDEEEVQTSNPNLDVKTLRARHEEADTRVILHCVHADTVVVAARDTGILVLLIAHYPKMKCKQLRLKAGTYMKPKYIPVHEVQNVLSFDDQVFETILPFHAITGCDTVSYLFGHSKKAAWEVFLTDNTLLSCLGIGALTPRVLKDAETFICKVYSVHRITSCDKARVTLFCKCKSQESLPPTSDSVTYHIQRAHYQSMIWRQATSQQPHLPSATTLG